MAGAKGIFGSLARLIHAFTGPWTRSNGAGWIVLIIFILILRWGFFELYSIPTDSMLPTLNGDRRFLRGDRVAVNKFIFGPRIPFTTNRVMPFWEPNRWDIVVFNNVDPAAENPILIKRVVGLPGERIHISDGHIQVNGETVLPPPELTDDLYYTDSLFTETDVEQNLLGLAQSGLVVPVRSPRDSDFIRLTEDIAALNTTTKNLDLEALADAERKDLLADVSPTSLRLVREWLDTQTGAQRPAFGVLEDDAHALIPEGHYLMLGDNSPYSLDGRFFGWVPHENLYGRAFAVAWPFANAKDLTGFTGTFSGLFFLIGIPGLLALWELSRNYLIFSWRVREGHPLLGLASGDRVLISRVAFGLRLPFMKQPSLFQRPPKAGETVAYLGRQKNDEVDLLFGTIRSPNEAPASPERYFVHSQASGHSEPLEIRVEELVGRVTSVWWPLGKRRRVEPAA